MKKISVVYSPDPNEILVGGGGGGVHKGYE